MKTKNIKIAILAFGLLMAFSYVYAQAPYIAKQAKMTVSGTSTLHEWESEVTKVEWTGTLKVTGNTLTEVKDVLVKIPVTSIKSTKGKIMDNKTYEAFNHEKYPTIQYKLTSAKVTGAGSDYTITATGNLSMAGATKPIEMVVKAKVQPNGEVILTASKKLNMKDFSMETPTAMMGTIKVGEEVTVAFQLTLNTNDNKNL
jgi:polyisoprenoid-binding protein YceI